jgi:hypothetical protein
MLMLGRDAANPCIQTRKVFLLLFGHKKKGFLWRKK